MDEKQRAAAIRTMKKVVQPSRKAAKKVYEELSKYASDPHFAMCPQSYQTEASTLKSSLDALVKAYDTALTEGSEATEIPDKHAEFKQLQERSIDMNKLIRKLYVTFGAI